VALLSSFCAHVLPQPNQRLFAQYKESTLNPHRMLPICI
jgi:hypothetical protein